jgi:hypothetical protein
VSVAVEAPVGSTSDDQPPGAALPTHHRHPTGTVARKEKRLAALTLQAVDFTERTWWALQDSNLRPTD